MQPNMQPTVGVLILNHNGKNWLPGLYESIFADPYDKKQVYLVDNHSGDGSCEMTVHGYPEVRILRLPGNLGYSTAYNTCVPLAIADGCDYVLWANNDVVIEPGCLGHLVRVATMDPRIGVVGPALLAWHSDEPNDFIKGNCPDAIPAIKAQSEEPIDVEWVEGSFPLVSEKCIQAIGCLDPYLYMGWEDADFCRRALYQGWRVVLAPAARVRHFGGASTKSSIQNAAHHTSIRARNYYIYKLTNQNQHFLKNVLDAMHLFLVNMKVLLPMSLKNAAVEAAMFLKVLGEWKTAYKKWVRDKAGGKPPLTEPN